MLRCRGCSGHRRIPRARFSRVVSPRFEMGFKERENALVRVSPTAGFTEVVPFEGIDGKVPGVFLKFNEPLHQTDNVLKVHVGVEHSMADEQRTLQSLYMRDW